MSQESAADRLKEPDEGTRSVNESSSLGAACNRLERLLPFVGQDTPITKMGAFLEGATPGGEPEWRTERVRWMREGPMQQFVVALMEIQKALEGMQPEERGRYGDVREIYDSAKAAYDEWERLNTLATIPDTESSTLQKLLEEVQSYSDQTNEGWAVRIDWEQISQMSSAERQEELVRQGETMIEYFGHALIHRIHRSSPDNIGK